MTAPFNARNSFNLSNEVKLTCNMGKLIPIMFEEVYPGDDWKNRTEIVVRLQPMLAPIMHRIDVYTHFFFVPTRLLWKDWEMFVTGGKYGNDSPNKDGSNPYVKPFVVLKSPDKHDLSSYFGLPCVQNYPDQTKYDPGTFKVDAMPFRAMALIWNEWYRDEILQDEIEISDEGGEDTTINTKTLYSRNWERDRYTSAKIAQQLGDPVYVPLGIDAPVIGNGQPFLLQNTGSTNTKDRNLVSVSAGSGVFTVGVRNDTVAVNATETYGLTDDPTKSGIVADLSQASAVTINDLRTAFQVQRFMEKQIRGGYRYVEHILSHFGVHSPDARLQRPEFLGGGRSPVVVSEVLQTSATSDVTPQANMAGHGISINANHAFTKSFNEYGYIIGLLSIMPRTSYQQGINPMWTRETKYDYLVPLLAHLSMRDIKNKELWVSGNEETDNATFGFTNPYDELRHRESRVAGDFVDNLNYWHAGRIFASAPKLNSEFVTSDPTKRIFAVTDEDVDSCIVDIYHECRAIRPLPKEGTPGLIDHD